MILGTAAKMFTIAGPVIVYGLSASVVYGLIYWITTLLSSKPPAQVVLIHNMACKMSPSVLPQGVLIPINRYAYLLYCWRMFSRFRPMTTQFLCLK